MILASVWYLVLAGAVLYPLWRPGYLLLLDWTPTPEVRWHIEGPLGVHQVPVQSVQWLLSLLLPTSILQRLILLGILWGAGLSAHVTALVQSGLARTFAGTLYAINSFVLVRLLAGHWTLLVAYALAPFAAKAIIAAATAPSRRRGLLAGAWIAGLAAISVHALIMLVLLVTAFAFCLVSMPIRRPVAGAFAWAVLAVVVGTAWWAVPAALGEAHAGSGPGAIDLFASTSTGGQPVPISLAAFRGFWIERFNPTGPPGWPILALALVCLTLWGAAVAVRDHRRPLALAMLAASLLGFGLALGVAHGPTESLARGLYRWVPGSMIFREPHKAMWLAALGYAWLGAVSVGWLATRGARMTRAAALLAVALPLVFTWQIFGGVGGSLRPVEYPESWKAADSLLRKDHDRFSVLWLPWELYQPLSFNDPREPLANPAPDFFSVDVIASDDPGLGTGLAPPKDARSVRIEELLARYQTLDRMGAELSRLAIKYVLLVPSEPSGSYRFLFRQKDLEVITRSPELVVFRNLAWPGG